MFLGDCGLAIQHVDGVDEFEVGYQVRADRQRQGVATEAAIAARDFAREVLHAPRLIAIIDPANKASQRAATKIGLTLEMQSVAEDGRSRLIYAGVP